MKRASLHSPGHKELITLLRELREKAGLTQTAAAEAIGRRQGYISDVETGDRGVDYLQLREFCAAYEIDPVEFVRTLEGRLRKLDTAKPGKRAKLRKA